jgi:hypothetical protein
MSSTEAILQTLRLAEDAIRTAGDPHLANNVYAVGLELGSKETPRDPDRFLGLAFPVIRVRYAGPTDHNGSRYIATLRGIRHTESYDHAQNGSYNALQAARACWDKYRAFYADAYAGDDQPRAFIPGDLDRDSYAFTVVPEGFLA